jgi:hypothetical protein
MFWQLQTAVFQPHTPTMSSLSSDRAASSVVLLSFTAQKTTSAKQIIQIRTKLEMLAVALHAESLEFCKYSLSHFLVSHMCEKTVFEFKLGERKIYSCLNLLSCNMLNLFCCFWRK